MLNSLNAGVSGLQQFQSQIDLIGNNIANVNTTGFKSARVNFADTFVEAMSGPGMADASSSFGSGVVTDGVMTSFKEAVLPPPKTSPIWLLRMVRGFLP